MADLTPATLPPDFIIPPEFTDWLAWWDDTYPHRGGYRQTDMLAAWLAGRIAGRAEDRTERTVEAPATADYPVRPLRGGPPWRCSKCYALTNDQSGVGLVCGLRLHATRPPCDGVIR